MKNFHIFLLSASFVALVVGFSAYKLATPDRNSIASQNEGAGSMSTIKDSSTLQNNVIQVPDNSYTDSTTNQGINSQNTTTIIKKSAVPAKRVYHQESDEADCNVSEEDCE